VVYFWRGVLLHVERYRIDNCRMMDAVYDHAHSAFQDIHYLVSIDM